jgi:hypothetical protein
MQQEAKSRQVSTSESLAMPCPSLINKKVNAI